MNITDKTTKVLAEIEARLIHPECGIEEQRALRSLKTAIEGLLAVLDLAETPDENDLKDYEYSMPVGRALATLCEQWEAGQ